MELVKVFSIIVISLAILLNHAKHRDVLYPPVLHGILWLGIIVLYFLSQSHFIPLSFQTYFVVLSGVITFSIGSAAVTHGFTGVKTQTRYKPTKKQDIFLWLVLILTVSALPLFLMKAHVYAVEGPSESNPYFNMRYNLSASPDRESYGILAYIGTLSIASACLHTLHFIGSKKWWRTVVAVVVSFVYVVLFTGRTRIFMLIISLLGILIFVGRIRLRTGLILFLVSACFAFVFIGVLTYKGGSPDETFSENVPSAFEHMRKYLLGSLPALDIYMRSDRSPGYGKYMFRFVFAVMEKLGFDDHAVLLVQEYVFVPDITNAYTVYRPYYADFLIFGALIAPFFIGLWHGLLYKFARSGRPLFIVLYALFLYPLFMQFFLDQYFNLLSTWIQFFIVLFVHYYCCGQKKLMKHA